MVDKRLALLTSSTALLFKNNFCSDAKILPKEIDID